MLAASSPEGLVERMMAAGVLIYAGVGVVGLLLGGKFPGLLRARARSGGGQHRGIFWVEVGVAVTVSGVMLKIFYMFADRGNDRTDDHGRPLHLRGDRSS